MASRKARLQVFYGIPGVAKSTLAVDFAHRHGIRTIIHTDYVREVQRRYVPPEHAPALAKVTHNSWELHGQPTRANIEAGFLDHVREVAIGIRAVVTKVVSDGFDAVIEGAHFHGTLINELREAHSGAEIAATLLVVEDATQLGRRIADKERNRAHDAAPKLWNKNLQVMLAIQDFLISDAHRYHLRVSTADEWINSCSPLQPNFSTSTTLR